MTPVEEYASILTDRMDQDLRRARLAAFKSKLGPKFDAVRVTYFDPKES